MRSNGRHEMVPTIEKWLLATACAEVPLGFSTEEACHRARSLIAEIVAQTVVPAQLEMDEDLRDVIWALSDELRRRQGDPLTFEHCESVYRFVSELHWENDSFRERADVLRRIARTGWRSAHRLVSVRKGRSAIWCSAKGKP